MYELLTFLGAVTPQLSLFSDLMSWMVKIRIQRPMKAQVLVMLPSVLLTITACWFLAPTIKEFYLPCWNEAQLAENFGTVIFKFPPAPLWLTIVYEMKNRELHSMREYTMCERREWEGFLQIWGPSHLVSSLSRAPK